MGNAGSAGGNGRRRQDSRRSHTPPPAPPMVTQPDIMANRYIFPGAAPLTGQYPNPNPNIPPGYYHQYPPPPPGYYPHHPPALPMPILVPYDHHNRVPHVDPAHAGWAAGGRCPYGPPPPPPYVEHQKAMTIRNDVNLKKDSLRVEKDEENPGKYLVAFNFDATAAGRASA